MSAIDLSDLEAEVDAFVREATRRPITPPFGSPARGLLPRLRYAVQWRADHERPEFLDGAGRQDWYEKGRLLWEPAPCGPRLPVWVGDWDESHLPLGWGGNLADTLTPLENGHARLRDDCAVTIWSADTRCWGLAHRGACSCVGDLLYRAVCAGRGCGWESDTHDSENAAVEAGLDHAHPGWRDLPTVPPAPEDKAAVEKWATRVRALYPEGWLERGGPIVTTRTTGGTRHVPNRTPWGGIDVGIRKD